jgi:hypothetical protein
MSALPADERAMPENEPEKNRKNPGSFPGFPSSPSLCGHHIDSIKTCRFLRPFPTIPFQTFGHPKKSHAEPLKPSAIQTVFRLLHFVTPCYTKNFCGRFHSHFAKPPNPNFYLP